MMPPVPLDFLRSVVAERGVSAAESEALLLALDGQSTAAIAEQLGITTIAVRKRLGEVYRKFDILGRGPGKLAEFKHQMLCLYQSGYTPQVVHGLRSGAIALPQRQDWGEAPDVTGYQQRSQEQATLQRWILKDGCRIVALAGMTGIGKTVLSVQVARHIADRFDVVLWRSLRHAPTWESFLADVMGGFPDLTVMSLGDGDTSRDRPATLSGLMEKLRQYRCLLVLDDYEALWEGGELSGKYPTEYEGFRDLIERMGETQHQSCLLLVCAEKPAELDALEGDKVRLLKPTETEAIARHIFQEKGISVDASQWQQLLERYRENVMALKLAAIAMKNLFGGNVLEFLRSTSLFLGDTLQQSLERQFHRLSPVEREILYWLSIEAEPATIATLMEDLLSPAPPSTLLQGLDSLDRRSLIVKVTDGEETKFCLPPLVREYVAEHLAHHACQEILETLRTQSCDRLHLLKSYDFTRNNERDRQRSIGEIIRSYLQRRLVKVDDAQKHIDRLRDLLSALPDCLPYELKYARKNLEALVLL